MKKANQAHIDGRLHSTKWKDETGNAKLKTEIVASKMIMLGISKLNNIDFSSSQPDVTQNNEEGDEYPF